MHIYIYTHFILSFKYHAFNSWRWSVRTETCSRCLRV